jgi:Mg-chelatase subunit ChlD
MNLTLSATLGKETFSTSGDEVPGRIAIDVEDIPQESLPLDIVFCVDASGSMRGNKLNNTIAGIKKSLQHLSSEDTFSVVSFDNSASVTVSQISGDNGRSAKSSIDSIDAGGGTNIINGLARAKEELDSMSSASLGKKLLGGGGSDRIKWIVLLTDGKPNSNVGDALKGVFSSLTSKSLGNSLAEKHRSIAEDLSKDGITIHTAGVGSYDKNDVKAISEGSQGEWVHCSSPRGVAKFFRKRVNSAGNVVATDPILRVEPANGSNIKNPTQSVPQSTDGGIKSNRSGFVAEAPDISGDKPPEFTFDVSVPPHEQNPDVTVAKAVLEVGSETVSEDIVGGYANMDLGKNEDVYIERATSVAANNAESNPEEAAKAIQQAKDEIGENETLNEAEKKVGMVKKGDKGAEDDLSRMIARKD